MRVVSAHSSRLGNRKINQDRCSIVTRDFATLITLADGMGGHLGGELAAQAVVDYFEQQFNALNDVPDNVREWLKVNALGAHNAVQEINTESVRQPRTTCVVCMIHNGHATWLHVGDSRLYLIRNGHVYIRTRDHSYVEDLIQNKAITEDEAITHPMRNYVTSCLGGSSALPFMSISQNQKLKERDIILVCSDGLWSPIEETRLLEVLSNNSISRATDALTELAEREAYPRCDNTTLATVQIIKTNDSNKDEADAIDQLDQAQDELQSAICSIEKAFKDYSAEFDNDSPNSKPDSDNRQE